MTVHVKPNALSFCSIFIEAFFGETKLGIATGFFWRHDNQDYLVTNWHVLTGFHPDSRQAISSDGATPDFLRIWLHTTEQLGRWDSYDLPLYDNQGRPLWREHTLYKSKVDVALLPVKIPGNFRSFPINKVEFDELK